jgi:hypothetical protein
MNKNGIILLFGIIATYGLGCSPSPSKASKIAEENQILLDYAMMVELFKDETGSYPSSTTDLANLFADSPQFLTDLKVNNVRISPNTPEQLIEMDGETGIFHYNALEKSGSFTPHKRGKK